MKLLMHFTSSCFFFHIVGSCITSKIVFVLYPPAVLIFFFFLICVVWLQIISAISITGPFLPGITIRKNLPPL